MNIDESWRQIDNTYKCPFCNKIYSKNGISTHIWRKHEDGINHGEKTGKGQIGRKAWNKSLTKDNDKRVKQYGVTFSSKYKNGEYKQSAFIKYIKENREQFLEYAKKGGLKSSYSQQRRSKNEKLFFKFCKMYFKTVENNKPIFNGWDADIILNDFKIAILWNGIWHYKQISKKQSLIQVQNRDKFKIENIEKCGYEAYIIMDLGKYNPEFVEKEFEKFKTFLLEKKIIDYNNLVRRNDGA